MPLKFAKETKQLVQSLNTPSESKVPNKAGNPKNNKKVICGFLADSSGCSFIRIAEPLMHLSYGDRAVTNMQHTMEFHPMNFMNYDCVLFQRQAAEHQLKYIKKLKEIQKQILDQKGSTFKLLFEVDDIFMLNVKGSDGRTYPGIPDYNAAKASFTDPKHDDRVKEIVHQCDEFVCCSEYMKETYKNTLEYDKITTIPNFISRRWAGNYYDPERVLENFEKNSKKPRIGWQGSATHLKVTGEIKDPKDLYDDFAHIGKVIVDTMDKYQWVLFGGCPLYLRQYVKSGQIELVEWVNIMEIHKKLSELDLQCMIAPLLANHFSHSKSWQKLVDSWVHGLPCVCQDSPPYKEARYKFTSGDEMIDQIDSIVKGGKYEKISRESRDLVEPLFIDKNLDEYMNLYFTPYGDPAREKCKYLKKYNPEQFA